ncbi:Trypanosome variant surface glycoprotein (A-type), putative [Trypanosoma equiperdum]|uniref:Trypanosome variant surface glycoprotein (A-type), putative n=1 Tax=Trypanosoma equiperdum TaxID=5694 RepID=A0A1G4I4Q7_TRYEQ|nr:Trypanosome variant surface glycoprotein (A-type), putative [Trypanosoma equiperdum]
MLTQHRLRLSAALVILAHTVHQAKETSGNALATQEKEEICGLAGELAEYPSYVNTKIKAAADAANELPTHELKLHIYTQQHDTATAKAMIPILAVLADKKKHSIVALATIGKGIEAAAAEVRLNVRLVEVVEFLADLH